MKNVYVKDVSYENFAGEEKSQKLHFHITPREFADWMIDHPAESDRLQMVFIQLETEMAGKAEKGLISREVMMEMMKLVRLLAELSYGTPSADNEYFSRPSSGYKFSESAAYDAFRIWLFEHPEEIEQFINTILNPQVVEEFAKKFKKPEPKIEDVETLSEDELKARYKALMESKGGHLSKSE